MTIELEDGPEAKKAKLLKKEYELSKPIEDLSYKVMQRVGYSALHTQRVLSSALTAATECY